VEALEHDKHVVTSAFEAVAAGLQSDLAGVKGKLEVLRDQRDRYQSSVPRVGVHFVQKAQGCWRLDMWLCCRPREVRA
jgi:hypothetical protein